MTQSPETPQSSPSIFPILLALLFGNFVIGTGAIMITGMLNLIATDLRITIPQAGQLLTVFALACAFGGPILATLFAPFDRRRVLVLALLLYGVGNVLAVWVNDYVGLLVLRFFTAFGAVVFTPVAAGVAGMLSTPEKRNSAIVTVFLGWSIAAVLGVPLATYIAAHSHWHWVMGAEAVLCVLAAAWVWWRVPAGLRGVSLNRAVWTSLLSNPALMTGLLVTLLSASGVFIMFTYLAPLYANYVGASPTQTAWLFASYGIMGVAGAIWLSRLMLKYTPSQLVAWTLVFTTASLVVWPVSGVHIVLAFVIALAWGLTGFSTNSAQQARLGALAKEHAPVAVALNSSALYSGQAIGSVLGGVLYSLNQPVVLPWVAAGFTLIALIVSQYSARRYEN